jgi:predicted NBD/HSP70 family sugar kinase
LLPTNENNARVRGLGPGSVRAHNRKLVFDRITMDGPVSRSELARTLGLSITAVGDLATELVKLGLVRQAGVGASGGGRPPVLLEAHSDETCVLGLALRAEQVQAVVVDPGGRVLARHRLPTPADQGPEAVAAALEAAGKAALAEVRAGRGRVPRLLAVGVACAGIVRADGQVMSPDVPDWGSVSLPLHAAMSEAFGVPVVVDNDANLGALAELRYGHGRGRDDLVYVLVHSGMGAGVVAGGELHRGHTRAAGEIGHTWLAVEGERCSCGNHGCLETLVSSRALARYVAEGIRLGRPSALEDVDADGPVDVDRIVASAVAGDRAAAAAAERIGEHLGIAFANIVHVYGPELVVLGGPLVPLGDLLFEPLEAVARRRTLAPLRDDVTFLPSALGADGPSLGACAAALDSWLAGQESPAGEREDPEEVPRVA